MFIVLLITSVNFNIGLPFNSVNLAWLEMDSCVVMTRIWTEFRMRS